MSRSVRRFAKFEQLENRNLLAATVALSGTVLNIVGTEQPDAFTLTYVAANRLQPQPSLNVSVAGKNYSFPVSSVREIRVDLRGGNDSWNGLAPGSTIPQYIRGGRGNDAITTGHGNDTIWGGDGDDTIIPSGGADTAYGDAGNDQMLMGNSDGLNNNLYPRDVAFGGLGDDSLYGGSNDTLYGDEGNDRFYSQGNVRYGGATMLGGDGDDIFYSRNGIRDSISGGKGRDRLATYDVTGRNIINENYREIEVIG